MGFIKGLPTLQYRSQLKHIARQLRKKMTDSEIVLWFHLRSRQILGVQFYRQKPIGKFIVDFFAPTMKLVIEIDGSQHMEAEHTEKDALRDKYMADIGLKVLRFNSREVLEETDAVVAVVYEMIAGQLSREIPLDPPFPKGEEEWPHFLKKEKS